MTYMYCTYCGSNSHTVTNCPSTWSGQGNRNRMRCDYCGSNQHNTNGCPKTARNNSKNYDDYILD